MARIGCTELSSLNIHQVMADYYLLERLVADGSRSAREAQRKLESWAAPRLMRYLAAICGGEMRHAGGAGDGCEGYECSQMDDPYLCECCGYYEDENHAPSCSYCGFPEDDDMHMECECEEEEGCSCDYDHDYEEAYWCDCFCPTRLCYMCESAQNGDIRIDGLHSTLEDWVLSESGGSEGSRGDSWGSFLHFHDKYGAKALKWLSDGFEEDGWPGGYGGEAWAFIARVAYEYQTGKMSAHAFMDRCWTLHHNGGNVFDKMYDSYTLDRLLMFQAQDKYGPLARVASPDVKDLWVIRPYVLSEAIDRDPVWLGLTLPEVAW